MLSDLFSVVKRECVPREFRVLAVVDHVIDMCHQREFSQIDHSELSLAVDGLSHAACHNQRFERHAREDIQSLLVGLALSQQNADLSGSATIDGDIEVSDSEDGAVFIGP